MDESYRQDSAGRKGNSGTRKVIVVPRILLHKEREDRVKGVPSQGYQCFTPTIINHAKKAFFDFKVGFLCNQLVLITRIQALPVLWNHSTRLNSNGYVTT